jgi:hypothetical protein
MKNFEFFKTIKKFYESHKDLAKFSLFVNILLNLFAKSSIFIFSNKYPFILSITISFSPLKQFL